MQLRHQLQHELKQICAKALGVSCVGRHDNFFELGGHSLMVLSLFNEIRTLTHSDLPLGALFQAPTIESLSALILESGVKLEALPGLATAKKGSIRLSEGENGRFLGGRASMHDLAPAPGLQVSENAASTGVRKGLAGPEAEAPPPRVRPAGPEDVAPLCTFLQGLDRNIGADKWRRLFNYQWLEKKPNLGFVLTAGDEIVGFLGAVYARRQIRGQSCVTCNFTSWYILPEYRGWGPLLLAAALRDQDVCYTNLTPSPTSARMCEAMGFTRLESQTIILPPLFHLDTLRTRGVEIIFDLDGIRSLLKDDQRPIFEDHLAYDCLHLALRERTECAYLVVKRRRIKRRQPLSELLYCSAPQILVRHLERAKLAILRRQRTVALMADMRLFQAPAPRGVWIRQRPPVLFRSSLLKPEEVDKLYSEVVLLPI